MRKSIEGISSAVMLASIAVMAITGCTNGDDVDTSAGLQSDGTYKVTDYDSHVAMCLSDHVTDSYRNECLMNARDNWK